MFDGLSVAEAQQLKPVQRSFRDFARSTETRPLPMIGRYVAAHPAPLTALIKGAATVSAALGHVEGFVPIWPHSGTPVELPAGWDAGALGIQTVPVRVWDETIRLTFGAAYDSLGPRLVRYLARRLNDEELRAVADGALALLVSAAEEPPAAGRAAPEVCFAFRVLEALDPLLPAAQAARTGCAALVHLLTQPTANWRPEVVRLFALHGAGQIGQSTVNALWGKAQSALTAEDGRPHPLDRADTDNFGYGACSASCAVAGLLAPVASPQQRQDFLRAIFASGPSRLATQHIEATAPSAGADERAQIREHLLSGLPVHEAEIYHDKERWLGRMPGLAGRGLAALALDPADADLALSRILGADRAFARAWWGTKNFRDAFYSEVAAEGDLRTPFLHAERIDAVIGLAPALGPDAADRAWSAVHRSLEALSEVQAAAMRENEPRKAIDEVIDRCRRALRALAPRISHRKLVDALDGAAIAAERQGVRENVDRLPQLLRRTLRAGLPPALLPSSLKAPALPVLEALAPRLDARQQAEVLATTLKNLDAPSAHERWYALQAAAELAPDLEAPQRAELFVRLAPEPSAEQPTRPQSEHAVALRQAEIELLAALVRAGRPTAEQLASTLRVAVAADPAFGRRGDLLRQTFAQRLDLLAALVEHLDGGAVARTLTRLLTRLGTLDSLSRGADPYQCLELLRVLLPRLSGVQLEAAWVAASAGPYAYWWNRGASSSERGYGAVARAAAPRLSDEVLLELFRAELALPAQHEDPRADQRCGLLHALSADLPVEQLLGLIERSMASLPETEAGPDGG